MSLHLFCAHPAPQRIPPLFPRTCTTHTHTHTHTHVHTCSVWPVPQLPALSAAATLLFLLCPSPNLFLVLSHIQSPFMDLYSLWHCLPTLHNSPWIPLTRAAGTACLNHPHFAVSRVTSGVTTIMTMWLVICMDLSPHCWQAVREQGSHACCWRGCPTLLHGTKHGVYAWQVPRDSLIVSVHEFTSEWTEELTPFAHPDALALCFLHPIGDGEPVAPSLYYSCSCPTRSDQHNLYRTDIRQKAPGGEETQTNPHRTSIKKYISRSPSHSKCSWLHINKRSPVKPIVEPRCSSMNQTLQHVTWFPI